MFDIHPTRTVHLSGRKGQTPLLSNTAVNNGINDYCAEEPTEKGNIITFSDTTESQKTIFYQGKPFIGFSHVQGLYPKVENVWFEKDCLYFISLFKLAIGEHYDYATKFNRKIATNIKIYLPILTKHGNPVIDKTYKYHNLGFIPNFRYMEERISELMEERISELDAYLKVSKLSGYKLSKEDKKIIQEEKSFVKFKIKNLFTSSNGDFDIQQKHIDNSGEMVITSGENNYGEMGKSTIKAKVFDKNTITIDMFGNVFFRDYQYKIVTHARVFSLKFISDLSIDNGLYIVSKLQYLKKIYSYSNMCSFSKIGEDYIELPVKKESIKEEKIQIDNIDFEYMEKYIKVLKKIIIKDVVKYKDKIIYETKKIVKK
ncbi:MAG: hypothetical protein J6P02_03080 [Lachnospiraceae bacterium]|nr:hypothetical protein [Lachnospiraceae bacterium]